MFPLLTGFICSNSRVDNRKTTFCGGKCEISEVERTEVGVISDFSYIIHLLFQLTII